MEPTTMIYCYRLFDVTLVQELFRHKSQLRPDAYISEDWNGELDAIRKTVVEGYRWARTEGTLAVFEKEEPAPTIGMQIPIHIAAQAEKMTAHGQAAT